MEASSSFYLKAPTSASLAHAKPCPITLSTPSNKSFSKASCALNNNMTPLDSSEALDNNNSSSSSSSSSSNGGLPSSSSSAIDFLTLCQRLKNTKRKGWVNHGVKDSESIADHMYRMAVMALISGDVPGINRDRCVKMAIVHDIAEAIVGDITPSDGIPKHEKSKLEKEAIDEMCGLLSGLAAEEVKQLWLEYENNSTPEANLVKDFDKIEMILQALEYESAQNKIMDDFFESTAGKFQTDVGKAWASEIVRRRKMRLESLNQ